MVFPPSFAFKPVLDPKRLEEVREKLRAAAATAVEALLSMGYSREVAQSAVEVQKDKIKAVYKDGVLIVDLPKGEVVKPKEIEIKVE